MYCTSHQHNILMQGFCSSLEVWIKSPKLLTCCVCCIFIDGASAGTLISFTLCLNLKTALTLPPTSKNKIEQNKQKFKIDPFPVPQKRIKHDFFSQGNRRDRWGESRDGSHNCLQESQLCIFRCLWLSQLWRNPKLRFFKAAVWACSSRGAWNNCSKKYKLLHSSQQRSSLKCLNANAVNCSWPIQTYQEAYEALPSLVLSAFPFCIIPQRCPEDHAKKQPVWFSTAYTGGIPDVLPWDEAKLHGNTWATSRSSSDTSAQHLHQNSWSTAQQHWKLRRKSAHWWLNCFQHPGYRLRQLAAVWSMITIKALVDGPPTSSGSSWDQSPFHYVEVESTTLKDIEAFGQTKSGWSLLCFQRNSLIFSFICEVLC